MPTAPAPFGLVQPLSVVGDGDSPIMERMPLHFMVPIDSRRSILFSIDGDGNHMKSDPHPSMPVIQGGRVIATTSFGSGPLIFVDLQTDGNYYGMEYPVPAAPFTSIEDLIAAACATLRRPCPFPDRNEDGEHVPAEMQPPVEPLETDRMEPSGDSSSKALLNTPTSEVTSPTCPQAHAVTPGSPILAKLRSDWGMEFYIRVDRGGSFHTYPDVGGPFQSIEQAENAIDRYLDGRQDPSMCKEKAGVSKVEMVIRQCVFWPDGTRKRRTKSHVLEKGRDQMRRLVHAVVDQYNEDHNLMGDLAYEPKDILQHEQFRENNMWYRHLNFIAKIKVVDDDDDDDDDGDDDDLDCWVDKLFFAELKETKQEGINGEWVVSCFCMVGPLDNGPCYSCLNGVKHPNKADAYTGGHVPPDVLGGLPAMWSDSDEEEDAKERRIRRSYENRKPFVVPWYATPKVKTGDTRL